MLLGETNINGITSFLFEKDGKLTGYQIIGWHKYPLDAFVFNELKKLQLSNNNKVIEESNYKIILDLDTGYKHYFKNDQENLSMFYEMNGVDETLYQGKGKANLRRKIGNIIFVSYAAFTLSFLSFASYKTIIQGVPQQELLIKKSFSLEQEENEILPLSIEEISEYVKTSTRLNEEEKDFLNNELLFADLLPYINKNPNLIEKLRNTLFDIDIQPEEEGKDCTGISGYNDGSNAIHVVSYDEDFFGDYKWVVDHEFCHNFQWASKDFNYLKEAVNELLASEYFDRHSITYTKPVKIAKCLMEIIGVEPILESHLCFEPCYLYDALTPYLTDEEIALFHIDKAIKDYTDQERDIRFKQLTHILEKLYYGIYGEDMWDNSMIAAIMNDGYYKRYYFNSEKIKNTEMYAIHYNETEYTIEDAIAAGYVHPYIPRTENVSLEECLQYDGEKNISFNSCIEEEIQNVNNKCLMVLLDNGVIMDIPFEYAIKAGYIDSVNCTVIYKDPTSDLNNPEIKYDLELNCYFEGDKVIVTINEKEYFSPIQKSVNMLN